MTLKGKVGQKKQKANDFWVASKTKMVTITSAGRLKKRAGYSAAKEKVHRNRKRLPKES